MNDNNKDEDNINEISNNEEDNKKDEYNIKSNQNFDSDKDDDDIIDEDFEKLPLDYGKPDHTFKIIVIGDSGVGKTCITYRITSGKFYEKIAPTIGFELFPYLAKYKDKIIKLEMWDTCGQEVYRSLIKSFFVNSSMAIIVYAIDNKNSFISIHDWIRQCRNNCSPMTKFILIGNKKDLEE